MTAQSISVDASGPCMFWLASPGFAERLEPVEELLRHQVTLGERQVEIIVLLVARYWTAQYVWSSHAPAALNHGVEADVARPFESALRCS